MAWHVNLQNPPRLYVSTPEASETPTPPAGWGLAPVVDRPLPDLSFALHPGAVSPVPFDDLVLGGAAACISVERLPDSGGDRAVPGRLALIVPVNFFEETDDRLA